jgi:hypothetical protein
VVEAVDVDDVRWFRTNRERPSICKWTTFCK